MIFKISISINLFKPRKKNLRHYEPSAPPKYELSGEKIDSEQSYCVGGRHMSNSYDAVEYEKVNHKAKKIVKIKKRKCDICRRSKSHFCTK